MVIQMGFNIILRIQLVYWFLCSGKLEKKEPSLDSHAHAVASISGLVFFFLYGSFGVAMVLFDFYSQSYSSIAIVYIISLLLIYLTVIKERQYLQGKAIVEFLPKNIAKKVCIKNALLIFCIGFSPMWILLIYVMIFKLGPN